MQHRPDFPAEFSVRAESALSSSMRSQLFNVVCVAEIDGNDTTQERERKRKPSLAGKWLEKTGFLSGKRH